MTSLATADALALRTLEYKVERKCFLFCINSKLYFSEFNIPNMLYVYLF